MPMVSDDEQNIDEASGRDPLEPEELAAPPEPPEPERTPSRLGGRPAGEQLREPKRLKETSVRRIDHRGEALPEDDVRAPLPEQAATLGESLANERRRQGKTIADVEASTRIRGKLIEALEHGEYDTLPSQAYVKGYIQSYAAYLEIPSGPLIAQYAAETAGRAAKDDEHPYIKMPVGPSLTGALSQRKGGRDRRPSALHLPGPMWVWVLVLVLVVVGIIGIGRLLARSDQEVPPLPQSGGVSAVTATGLPSGVPTSSAVSTAAAGETATTFAGGIPKPPAGQFVVQVKTRVGGSTNVRIRTDGAIKFDAVMPGGQKQTTFATNLVTIRATDATALQSITRNGRLFDIPPADSTGGVTVQIPKP
jgi:cytoskeletal protein RodZ